MAKLKIGVLISGRGTNLQAIIDACKDPSYPVEISCVISNNDDVIGLERARDAGIDSHIINHREFPSREEFDQALNTSLLDYGIKFIVLAGFMRILTPWFTEQWKNRIINIHPSLLPKHKGAHAHEEVIRDGDNVSGCTVHFVTSEMDSGPIILQKQVEVKPSDTLETLATRILAKEHAALPEALELIDRGKVKVIGDQVVREGMI